MPEIPVFNDPHGEYYPPDQEAGFEDMLFAPQVPEKVIEQEKTPEQLRHEGFHEEALSGRESYAGPSGGRYSIALDDVCVFGGWPRRHQRIGKHCPHGMLETLEMYGDSDAS
jgi:hypothetical protein